MESIDYNKSNNNLKPVVSVCVQTYNHASYIRDCLDGILMQQTNFPFEIILGEDESNDGTRDVCIEYAEKYPDRIRLFLRSRKDVIYIGGSPTGRFNFSENLKAARGKYIAICEGDDYWGDPLKLQKQVDFLEEHDDYSVAYHDAKIINKENEVIKESKLPDRLKKDKTKIELQQGSLALTLTICYRNTFREFPDEFYHVKNGDTFLISLLGHYGKGKYLDDIEAAYYRIHAGGMWSSLKEQEKHISQGTTFYYLYKYYIRIGNKELSKFYKKKLKAHYKIVAILYLKHYNFFKSFSFFLKMFKI